MTDKLEPTPTKPRMKDCAYNLFRNRQRPELLCAVPEDCPVPGFLGSEGWTFEHVLRSTDIRPPGFNDTAAYAGVRFNGFYLFQITAAHGKLAA